MPPMPEPTTAEPGTPEKLEVMIARHAAGLCVTHPDDCREFNRRIENNAVRLIVGSVRETNRRGVRWDRQGNRHWRPKFTGGW